MWIATKYGFFSIAHGTKEALGHEIDPEVIMIRARDRAHLESLLRKFWVEPYPEIRESLNTDYPFRVITNNEKLVDVMTKFSTDLDYTNFKNAAHENLPEDVAYQNFLSDTWVNGFRMQST